MSRAFALSLKRPHEQLGLPMPVGRRLGEWGKTSSVAVVIGLTVLLASAYIYQVNRSATRSFELRALEKREAQLREQVASLENATIEMQSIHVLEERTRGLGYIPVSQIEMLNEADGQYALAH